MSPRENSWAETGSTNMSEFCTNSTAILSIRCRTEFMNIAIFFCHAYITLLILLHLRCTRQGSGSQHCRRFVGHSLRAVLSLLLLLAHLAELGAAVLGHHGHLEAAAALLAWIASQFLSARAEALHEPRFLLLSAVFWFACGLVRGAAAFHRVWDIGLDAGHVTLLAAAVVTVLCYALALCDIYTVVSELKLRQQDTRPVADHGYRHQTASWYSRVTFYWLTPLLREGYHRPLELEDLGILPHKEMAATQFDLFNSVFKWEKKVAWSEGSSVNLWKCYGRCYWANFALGGLLKLLGDCVGIIPPLGTSVVIEYVSNSSHFKTDVPHLVTVWELLSNGYVMAVVVLLSAIAQGSLSQASTHIINVEGIRLKTALQALVYSKSLKLRGLSNEDDSAQESKSGTLTNMMSEDTFNIMSCYWIGHYIWAIPLKISILMYLLYCKLGISAIIGATCCILILTPLQFLIGRQMSSNSKQISDWTDKRLRQTNEVLQGVRLLKLCGWEDDFMDRILHTRHKELVALDKDSLYWGILTFLTHTSSALITLVTLAAFHFLNDSSLSPAAVFSGLALFNQLTVPLLIFPITIPIIISAMVSTRRLQEYLAQEETQVVTLVGTKVEELVSQPNPIDSGSESGSESVFGLGNIVEHEEPDDNTNKPDIEMDKYMPAVAVEDAAFSWSLHTVVPSLVIPSLHIPAAKLTMIIGTTGSGKSSLLSALLGEMLRLNGAVRWSKGCSIAYVAQRPWLLNSSLRDNILFGYPYRERRYSRVMAATALKPDFDILPGKDMTEIGERGINLSGGQRQRVAIARAIYSKANVVIMDDPFSALDNTVAQHVFEEGIKRLYNKQKRTVILVTHNIQLIPYAHQVVVMDGGHIHSCCNPLDLDQRGVSIMGQAMDEVQRGRTARERWQLVKLMSRIGLQLKQRHLFDGTWRADHITPTVFVPFRRSLSKFSGSRYFTHDLPLPTDECEGEEVVERMQRAVSTTSLPWPQHRPATRASSLQSRTTTTPCLKRTTTFIKDTMPNRRVAESIGGRLIRQILSVSTQRLVLVDEPGRPTLHRLSSTTSACSNDSLDGDTCENTAWGAHETLLEEREYGQIGQHVYLSYLRACGILLGILYLTATVSWQGLRVFTDYWLSEWTEHRGDQMRFYLHVYGALSLASIVLSLATNGLGQFCGAKARRRLHDTMLKGLLNSPIRFFETTPLGRIMNRFSTDLSIIDKKIATSLQRLLQFLLLCFSSILVNCIVTPWFMLLAAPLCLIYYVVQKFYRCSTRELQRLDNISSSPIMSHFTETLTGLETIRAFSQQQRFTTALFNKLDIHTNVFLIINSCNRWLGIALDYLGGVIVFLAMLVSLVLSGLWPNHVTPALVGLAINYTLLIPIYLNWVVKFLADMEMYMGAVERVVQYSSIDSEKYRTSVQVPSCWPQHGDVKFANLSLRYDANRERVITDLNLHIPAGQKIGICGRTGSGKSSLVMSLFDMVALREGFVYVDGMDILSVPLKVLRSRLSIIPQDVIMFSGTIRDNLDLRQEFTDSQLWDSLERAQMKDVVTTQLGGLDGQVGEGGSKLSCGQRQLLCLARAILHQAVILVMDEATSSLDPVTENKFLEVASKAFADKTVITIAHRPNCLLGCDRVIVLDQGCIVEDGSPSILCSQKKSAFSTMLQKTEQSM